MWVINQIRCMMLAYMTLSQDQHCVIDSVPIPVVQFHLTPSSHGVWPTHGADFGYISSKKEVIFGYKLHRLTTPSGLTLDFVLAQASAHDLSVGSKLLTEHSDRLVIGDKAFFSVEVTAELWRHSRIRLPAMTRRNQKRQLPKPVRLLFNSLRRIIETVNSQLAAQFRNETNHALTF